MCSPVLGHAKKYRDDQWRQKQEEEQERAGQRAKRDLFVQHRAEARKGYPESYFLTAQDYYLGRGTAQNPKKALHYAKKAFKAQEERGSVLYAVFLMNGTGTQPDPEKAYEILTSLAPYRADAAYYLAKLHFSGKAAQADEQEGLCWLQRAAEEGLSPALTALAERHLTGSGVEKDEQKALTLYQKAADQDYLPAQLKTAELYTQGAKADPQKAFYYTYQAAKAHHPLAQWKTAQYFAQGYGTEKSPSLAVFWMTKAAKRNVREAQLELARRYREGDGVRAQRAQTQYWEQRAQKNEPVSFKDVDFGY